MQITPIQKKYNYNLKTNTAFQAKIILAEKNNALIKKAIKSSFNHELLKYNLDEIFKYQPKTTLLVQMDKLDKPKHDATHEILIINQNNAQIIKDTWGEKGRHAWAFGNLINRLTDLRDKLVNDFWNKPAIERKNIPNILSHEIFVDECDFDYDKHLRECDQKETIHKLSSKLDDTSSNLNGMIREYEYLRMEAQRRKPLKEPVQTNNYSSSNNDDDETWKEIRRIKELREKYPQPYSEQEKNIAIWKATMLRNCNK